MASNSKNRSSKDKADKDRAGNPISKRRREILDITAKMIARRGYGSASIRDIGSAVGLRGASIYSHFASKDEMMLELLVPPLREILEALESNVNAPGNGIERLQQLLENAIEVSFRHREAFIILFQERHIIEEQESLQEISQLNASISPLWLQVIKDGQQDGSITNTLTPAMISTALYSLIFGVISDRHIGLQFATNSKALPLKQAQHMARHVLLKGIALN